MSYGYEIRCAFAKAYARLGNATHALREVLGEARANLMKPHTLRARASDLLNDYRTVEMIDENIAEMQANGEILPHFRGRTIRTDLIEETPPKPDFFSDERSGKKRGRQSPLMPTKYLKRLNNLLKEKQVNPKEIITKQNP